MKTVQVVCIDQSDEPFPHADAPDERHHALGQVDQLDAIAVSTANVST